MGLSLPVLHAACFNLYHKCSFGVHVLVELRLSLVRTIAPHQLNWTEQRPVRCEQDFTK